MLKAKIVPNEVDFLWTNNYSAKYNLFNWRYPKR